MGTCRNAFRYVRISAHSPFITGPILMPHGGRVILRKGNITNPQHRPFLTRDVDVLWCNNFGLIMGSRSLPGETHWCVDDHIGGLFTQLKPGAKLVTLEPIQRLPHSLATATMLRQSRGLPDSNEASFYEVEKIIPQPDKTISRSKMMLHFMSTPALAVQPHSCAMFQAATTAIILLLHTSSKMKDRHRKGCYL